MPFDSQQEQGGITLSAIHRLWRRNARVTHYKLDFDLAISARPYL